MKNTVKRKPVNPSDFAIVPSVFEKYVEDLFSIDNKLAYEAFKILALKIYVYSRILRKRNLVQLLAVHIALRDKSSAALSMNEFQLTLELVMPGKYPPLSGSMRRGLALKLAYAAHLEVPSKGLEAFLTKLPPVKVIKAELGLIRVVEASNEGLIRPPLRRAKAQRRSQKKRRPVPHRLAGSTSDKLRKSGARKAKRLLLENQKD